MLERASVVDEQFVNRVLQGDFPQANSIISMQDAQLDKKQRSSFSTEPYLLPDKERIIEAVIELQSDKREKEIGRLVIS